jgi:hypothetical protein
MIIWLASYPKSGNTWVRLFLDHLFLNAKKFNINNSYVTQFPLRKHFSDLTPNINDLNELARNCKAAQLKLNLDNKVKILKTHNALWTWNNNKYSFTDENCTLGVIHVVRDPRNIITSILKYYRKKNYKDALEFMKDNKVLGGSKEENGLPTIIASWSNHYNSWKKFKKNNLLIKYEDLLNEPKKEFYRITDFLSSIGKFQFDRNKINKTIEYCNFENISKQEDDYGFLGNSRENKENNQKFFYLGPNNKWQNLLDNEIKFNLENLFKNEMKELNYL